MALKRGFYIFPILFLIGIGIYGCDQVASSLIDRHELYEKKEFVWFGLNRWYFWQDRVPVLADERLDDKQSLTSYLKRFGDEIELFESLRYRDDKFSWFIEDFEVHEAARLGSAKSFGFRFGLSRLEGSNEVFGYVQYVVRNSQADEAGLKRGDIFNRVNGKRLTLDNYEQVLDTDQYELGFAIFRNYQNNLTRLTDTDKTTHLTATVIHENPVHTAEMYILGNYTVGYLLYNAFRFNYHEQLNNRFKEFKNNNVNELVVDLRYNSGGALITSTLLATLISGRGSESTFAKLTYNDKRSNQNFSYPFMDQLVVYNENGELIDENAELFPLNLNRVFVITSSRTASASEAVINGLKAHGVEVIIIGEKTAGKDEGSMTLYDAPPTYTLQSRDNLNPNHKRAMQPIIFKIFNSAGENYPNGFVPDVQISETSYIGNLTNLGSPNEPLFSRALSYITGSFFALRTEDELGFGERIADSPELTNPLFDEFYLSPSDFNLFQDMNNPGF